MTTTKTISRVQVYWDSQDSANEGWAVRWHIDGQEQSDAVSIDATASLDDAIDQACHDLDLSLTHDDFTRDARRDGGCGDWSAA
jgi:hypothetical protein